MGNSKRASHSTPLPALGTSLHGGGHPWGLLFAVEDRVRDPWEEEVDDSAVPSLTVSFCKSCSWPRP